MEAKITGLIGSKEACRHSASPAFQNAMIRKAGINAVYSLFPADEKNIESVMKSLISHPLFAGANVTMPFKEVAARIAKSRDDAVNTIAKNGGKIIACNTDSAAVKRMIKEGFCGDEKNARILLLGAGGAAKGALLALLELGIKNIFVSNRTKERAAHLAKKYKVSFAQWEDREALAKESDIIINATSLGMKGEIPISADALSKSSLVIDMPYAKGATPLSAGCRKRGIKVFCGKKMLLYQGVESFKIWFEREPDERTGWLSILCALDSIKIWIIGMMGSGKTTTAKRTSVLSGIRFVDMDDIIEERHGPITRIFRERGEEAFRDIETALLKEIASEEKSAIIATGGGCVLRRENVEIMKESGIILFMDAPLHEIKKRLKGSEVEKRPLLHKWSVEKIYNERKRIYEDACDGKIKSGEDVISWLRKLEWK